MKPDFDQLLRDAREHNPDTAAAQLGFQTRLTANIRQLRANNDANANLLDQFGNWLWRAALGLTPAVAIIITAFFLTNDNALALPSGTDSLLSYVIDAIPISL